MLIGCNALMYICSGEKGELGKGRQFHPCVQSEEGPSPKPRIPEGLIKY